MSAVRPLISVKAGKCTQAGTRIIPSPEPGLLYIYNSVEDDLLHFCWRRRSATQPQAEDDLIIFPQDVTFTPYTACTTGRVFVLKFTSSSQRHFFWLQSKSESDSNPGHWSNRDRRWGETINNILQGSSEDDDDEMMGDPDAELGSEDIEEEGNASRRGGADGGRADSPSPFNTTSPSSNPSDFLKSLININIGNAPPASDPSGAGPSHYGQQTPPTLSLHDLLGTATTVPLLHTLPTAALDQLCANLPPALIPRGATATQKRDVIRRVLQSPQFAQSCVSLTVALRDGALRGVADSLQVPLRPGEEASGTDQVELFVGGVRRGVERELERELEREQELEQGADDEMED
ncbi:proteasome complex subunit Rpn13 ubiquitin receptor-domain-containing protein [Morchella snyderi]|nr:proteasome complex subunit Rpn13 ubiquitin receptor-domain-containing protein [Morchella snyderi]